MSNALKWLTTHPGEAIAYVMLALSVLGAVLPADSKAGQVVRRLAIDLANKNLRFTPPVEPPRPGVGTVIVAEKKEGP